jgi:LacI family transcriptional regulator
MSFAGVETGAPIEQGRITLQVLADRLSVSTATVSLALRGSALVADATREKVQALARELGYVYNRSAASLRTSRTHMLGVVFHDFTNPFFMGLLASVEDTIREAGLSIVLGTYAENTRGNGRRYNESIERQQRVFETLREYRPDGMLLCAAGGSDERHLQNLKAGAIPIVQVMREVDAGLDYVGAHDVMGVELALRHLYELGHRQIAMVGGAHTVSTGRSRQNAYRLTMNSLGLSIDEDLIIDGFGTRETGFRGIQTLLEKRHPPTAILCFNDLTAFGVLMGMRHKGLEAGRDISVIGCDDISEAEQWFPGLTTIRNHEDRIGQRAAEMLLARIARPSKPIERALIDVDLIVRGTTAAPR